jgi:RNA polymerase sigma-70 factor (ECF subfamily)
MEFDNHRQLEESSHRVLPEPSEVIELFYERIYAFLRRLTATDADAADLTQQTFGRLWEKLPTFAGRSSLASWIHSIAYRLFLDWRRKNRRVESKSDDWWAACPAIEPSPDEIVSRIDLQATVFKYVDALEPSLRDTIHLHYYQQLTLQETADAMEVALNTVKYRRQQALAELQKKLTSQPSPLKPVTAIK